MSGGSRGEGVVWSGLDARLAELGYDASTLEPEHHVDEISSGAETLFSRNPAVTSIVPTADVVTPRTKPRS